MAFGALLGAILPNVIGGLFKNTTATSAGLDAAQTVFQNEMMVDQIKSLRTQATVAHRNQAFNIQMMHDSEEAKEADLMQNFVVTVAGADKKELEKLVQSVSS